MYVHGKNKCKELFESIVLEWMVFGVGILFV